MSSIDKTYLARTSSGELARLWLAVCITLALSAYWLAIHLNDRLRAFFEQFSSLPIAQWLADGAFVWLLALLWIANRRWRDCLRHEAELDRVLSSITPEALIVVTPGRYIAGCNGSVLTLFGYDASEVIGHKTDVLYEDRRQPPGQKTVRADLETVGFHTGYGTGRKKDGSTFAIALTTAKLQGSPGAVILIRDISEQRRIEQTLRQMQAELEQRVQLRTAELQAANNDLLRETTERRLAEEALRTSETTYRTLTESSPDMICLLDGEGRILYINPRAADFLGAHPEALIGKTHSEFFSAETGTLYLQAVRLVFEKGTPISSDAPECLSRTGTWFDTRMIPILNENGATAAVLSICRDITERRRNETALRESERNLRILASQLSLAEERERRRIATGLHDGIGQTLAISKMKLGALASEHANNPSTAAELAQVRAQIDEAIRETRELTEALSPPVLYELGIEGALEWLAEQMARQHSIPVIFRSDRKPKPLDETMRVVLFQAARELVLNAIKHAAPRHVRMHCDSVEGGVVLTVEDDGAGFALTEMEERLRRQSGFGLFYIRERMAFLGGKVMIDSRQGGGTRVVLQAPLSLDDGGRGGRMS